MLKLDAGLVLVLVPVLVPQEDVRVQLLEPEAVRPESKTWENDPTREKKTSCPLDCSAGDILREVSNADLPFVEATVRCPLASLEK